MSLVRAETRRLFRRRLTSVLLIGVVLVLAAIAASTFVSNEKASPAQVAAAKQQAERQYQEAAADAEAEKQRCLTAAPGTAEAEKYPPNCADIYTPRPSEFEYVWYLPETFDLRDEFPDMISLFAVLMAAAAYLIGATFVGAEWHSGAMMNLLLWRPQRLVVLGTKLGVFLGWLAGVTVLLGAAWAGAFRLIAEFRGDTGPMTSGVWQSFGLMGLRGLGLVLAAGAIGFALASLGRHTGMALGALIGLTAVQIGVYVLAGFSGLKFPEAYLVPLWGYVWLYQREVLEDWSCDGMTGGGDCAAETFTMTWQMAGAGSAVVLAVVVGAAMWAMRVRDVN
ncbi:ABC transporter permease subunit [Actinoplanes hulinensis]|uniref:ABC transporter permease subunit n=1 Tax=Actinoplanes hulinensis TaxID=1144547 RepID=A0ABS7AYE0_9ACTN|nr:ABC transporter permease subunit [Actinoplanes hulinensis]MBW6433431.1 ABC transporter permease subunit [Actinoplanes hulinensis]